MDQLERYRWLVVALFAVPLLVGIGFLLHDRLSAPEPLQINSEGFPTGDLRVYITGAVQQPGVYPLQDGDRCRLHAPDESGEVAEARRLGGFRRELDEERKSSRSRGDDCSSSPNARCRSVGGQSQTDPGMLSTRRVAGSAGWSDGR